MLRGGNWENIANSSGWFIRRRKEKFGLMARRDGRYKVKRGGRGEVIIMDGLLLFRMYRGWGLHWSLESIQ